MGERKERNQRDTDRHPGSHLSYWLKSNWAIVVVMAGVFWNLIELHFSTQRGLEDIRQMQEWRQQMFGRDKMEAFLRQRIETEWRLKALEKGR